VIAEMIPCLSDHHPQVRSPTFQLGDLSFVWDACADSAGVMVEQVRKNGAEALATLVPKGHIAVISALSNVLGDSMVDVRKAAMQSLVVITVMKNAIHCQCVPVVIILVLPLLTAEECALVQDKNNATVITALCNKLKSPEWHVRAAATDAILKLCDVGDSATVAALLKLLKVSRSITAWFLEHHGTHQCVCRRTRSGMSGRQPSSRWARWRNRVHARAPKMVVFAIRSQTFWECWKTRRQRCVYMRTHGIDMTLVS